jgi:hypothetical protein
MVATGSQYEHFLNEQIKRNNPELNRHQRRARVKEIMKGIRHKKPELPEELERYFYDEIHPDLGICCFSGKPNNILMWSHYADSHRGICIKFEVSSDTLLLSLAQLVNYQIDYPIVNPITDSEDKQFKSGLLTKSEDWRYEEELRIIMHKNGAGQHEFPGEALEGIILGVNISDENREEINNWVKERKHPTTVYQAYLKEREYGIEIKTLKENYI